MDKAIASALKDGNKYEQQGDKKSGQQAADLYEKAVGKYGTALERGAQGELGLEALMGKGDCYQKWAHALRGKLQSYSNDDLTIEVERRAYKRAEALYQSAVDAYKETDVRGCHMDFNACVNCGNTLACWAEICEPKSAARQLYDAVSQYHAALQLDSEDNEVWQNLGDALVQLGEILCESGQQPEGEECFCEAFDAYNQSCGLSDSRKGDDLPGLLENWGMGLVTASKCVEDIALKEEYAKAAMKRLQDAAAFNIGDPSPYCGIGNALLARSEVESIDQALVTLSESQSEGFEEALRIERGCVEAVLGSAEVHTAVGKLMMEIGDSERAHKSFTKAADVYGHALASPQALGGFNDRSIVQYNYACACVQCGRNRIAEIVLRRLVKIHGARASDLAEDDDFDSVRHEPWFQQLLVDAGEITD